MKTLQTSLVLLGTLLTLSGFAQYERPVATYTGHNKAIFLELGGSGLLYSFNYDQRLQRGRQDGMGFRVGIGGLGASFSADGEGTRARASYVAAPLTFNYLLGARRHALELGAGATLFNGQVDGQVDDQNFDVNGFAAIPHANIGYRFQALDDGFVGRFTYSPFLSGGYAHFGLSFGITLK